MKYALYDILLHLALTLSLPYFIIKALTTHKYREGIAERFGLIAPSKTRALSGGQVVWFHSISVGETKAVEPVLRLFRKRNPRVKIVLSTVTVTGNKTARALPAGLFDALIYFPLDLSWTVASAFGRLKPCAIVIVEKEVWPNFYRLASSIGVPIVVINGGISKQSLARFVRFGFFMREVFGMVSFYCARSKEDLDRALQAGVPRAKAAHCGNIKFDICAPADLQTRRESLAKAFDLKQDEPVIVAGSTHDGEEAGILAMFSRLREKFPGLRLILAPRHPERFSAVESLIKKSGFSCALRSRPSGPSDVALLDTVGELAALYSFASVAIVGGSLVPGIGGHNLLEPALFARPVLYGRYIDSCLAMAELLEAAGGGMRAAGFEDLANKVERWLSDPNERRRVGGAAKLSVEANTGAALKSVEAIEHQMHRI